MSSGCSGEPGWSAGAAAPAEGRPAALESFARSPASDRAVTPPSSCIGHLGPGSPDRAALAPGALRPRAGTIPYRPRWRLKKSSDALNTFSHLPCTRKSCTSSGKTISSCGIRRALSSCTRPVVCEKGDVPVVVSVHEEHRRLPLIDRRDGRRLERGGAGVDAVPPQVDASDVHTRLEDVRVARESHRRDQPAIGEPPQPDPLGVHVGTRLQVLGRRVDVLVLR